MAKHTKQHLMAALRTWIDQACDEHGYVHDEDLGPLYESLPAPSRQMLREELARAKDDRDGDPESDDEANQR